MVKKKMEELNQEEKARERVIPTDTIQFNFAR